MNQYCYRLKNDTEIFKRFETVEREQKRWLKLVPEFARIIGIQLEENMQIMISERLCISGLDKKKYADDLNQDGRTFKSNSKQQRAYKKWLKDNEFNPVNFTYPSHLKLGIWAFGRIKSNVVFHDKVCYYYIETENKCDAFDGGIITPIEQTEYHLALESEAKRNREVA